MAFPKIFNRFPTLFYTLFLGILLGSQPCYSRDMSGRTGIGFINSFSNSTWSRPVPAMSVKYGVSKDMSVLVAGGFNTSLPTAYTFAGKVFKNIFYEQNLNFYAAGALALLKDIVPGFEIQALLGAEFFIPGLESLGWAFETGVAGTNTSGSFGIRTLGYTFVNAGVHFYF